MSYLAQILQCTRQFTVPPEVIAGAVVCEENQDGCCGGSIGTGPDIVGFVTEFVTISLPDDGWGLGAETDEVDPTNCCGGAVVGSPALKVQTTTLELPPGFEIVGTYCVTNGRCCADLDAWSDLVDYAATFSLTWSGGGSVSTTCTGKLAGNHTCSGCYWTDYFVGAACAAPGWEVVVVGGMSFDGASWKLPVQVFLGGNLIAFATLDGTFDGFSGSFTGVLDTNTFAGLSGGYVGGPITVVIS